MAFIKRAPEFLDICSINELPLYIIEKKILEERAKTFISAFKNQVDDIHVFYALKSNNCPDIAKILIKSGLGLDVSGGPELLSALRLGSKNIIFSGPGKTDKEIEMVIENHDKVTLLIDSFGELERAAKAAEKYKIQIRAGVRLTTQENGLWRKFGILVSDLKDFFQKSFEYDYINLRGIQFHTSWNLNPKAQTDFIVRLGEHIKTLNPEYRKKIEFIDIGGGYWPAAGEWLQWNGIPAGQISKILVPEFQPENQYFHFASEPVENFAYKIGQALKKHIFPYVKCKIYTEPGRWLCNDAMHIFLTVIDKKAQDMVITDGGTNIMGWERYESDYCPVINLTCPSETEKKCHIFGSLCTPHDIWGFGYFGTSIEPGDILMIPNQGAYTYSLQQNFIKQAAQVVVI
ncbi:Diaminopimelate decarboxylase [Desulfonema limicola]|uniref:Diaminopimelate decarboxylase n=2 Tax=Desulfonema limicola TaxID=45656 RepID=A0A975GED7_9BACT|nr:Diaminopimelate decarboxylase [Desulfonema limicola]